MLGGTRKLSRRRLCTDGFKHVIFQILNAHVFFLTTQLPDKVLSGGWMPPGWMDMPPGWRRHADTSSLPPLSSIL